MNENQENMSEINNQESQNLQPQPEIGTGAAEDAGKEQDLASRLAESEKQVEYYKDLLLRKVADFDNFKKRAENELASIVRYGKTDVLQSL